MLKLLHQLNPIIKLSLLDEDMPDYVKDMIEDTVDKYWPDIEDEIIFYLRLKMNEPYRKMARDNEWCYPCPLFYPLKAIRAFYLYAILPCKYFFNIYLKYLDNNSFWS